MHAYIKKKSRTAVPPSTEPKMDEGDESAEIEAAESICWGLSGLSPSWNLISDFVLQPDVENKHIFNIAANGVYSAKAAYEGLFTGYVSFGHNEKSLGELGPPPNDTSSFGSRPGQLIGWPPERCPLRDQASETLDHILVSCVFAREFWFLLLHSLAPTPGAVSFLGW
jgi:hypothetical protein